MGHPVVTDNNTLLFALGKIVTDNTLLSALGKIVNEIILYILIWVR